MTGGDQSPDSCGLRKRKASTNETGLVQIPTDVRLAKGESVTTRTNPVSGSIVEVCGVGEPLPKSDFVAAKVSKRLQQAALYSIRKYAAQMTIEPIRLRGFATEETVARNANQAEFAKAT